LRVRSFCAALKTSYRRMFDHFVHPISVELISHTSFIFSYLCCPLGCPLGHKLHSKLHVVACSIILCCSQNGGRHATNFFIDKLVHTNFECYYTFARSATREAYRRSRLPAVHQLACQPLRRAAQNSRTRSNTTPNKRGPDK